MEAGGQGQGGSNPRLKNRGGRAPLLFRASGIGATTTQLRKAHYIKYQHRSSGVSDVSIETPHNKILRLKQVASTLFFFLVVNHSEAWGSRESRVEPRITRCMPEKGTKWTWFTIVFTSFAHNTRLSPSLFDLIFIRHWEVAVWWVEYTLLEGGGHWFNGYNSSIPTWSYISHWCHELLFSTLPEIHSPLLGIYH